MNDKKPCHWLGSPPPKLGLKHKIYWYLYKIHGFITVMYPMLIVCTQFSVMQK
jgi:hypothetical protein